MSRNPFTHSIVSYPNRGHWGKSSWRGNCSGHIIKQSISTYMSRERNGLFFDPSKGSDTSGDVAREMNVRYKGLDLHEGFNVVTDDLLDALGEHGELGLWHPPYWSMIPYAQAVWQGEGKEHDLGSCESLSDFLERSQLALMNIYDALIEDGNGHYCILIGNMRKAGKYYDLTGMMQRMAPGELTDVIIKAQHNCVSDRRTYKKPLVRIAHETLLVFRKDKRFLTAIDFAIAMEFRTQRLASMTWRNMLRHVMRKGNPLSLSELYTKIEPLAVQRGTNKHWKDKIRQTLQINKEFKNIEKGVWAVA